jgi:hypothetical protein
MRLLTLTLIIAAGTVMLFAPRAEAQFGGQGGGQGGGQLPGSQGGQNQTQLQSLSGSIQSPGTLPKIIGRSTQGNFGARAIGSGTRQRFRGFMGQSMSGGSNFSNSGAYRNSRTQLPGSGMGSFSSFSTAQRGQQGGNAQAQAQGQQQPQRRSGTSATKLAKPIKVKVGFENDSSPFADARSMAGLQRRVGRIAALDLEGVSIEGRTAVLRGSVASDQARLLAEQLILLEPGIDSVRNELTSSWKAPEPALGRQGNQPPDEPDKGPTNPNREDPSVDSLPEPN